ncbi:hypothetical protein ACHAXS_006986 [Conticribra weissflogii]
MEFDVAALIFSTETSLNALTGNTGTMKTSRITADRAATEEEIGEEVSLINESVVAPQAWELGCCS